MDHFVRKGVSCPNQVAVLKLNPFISGNMLDIVEGVARMLFRHNCRGSPSNFTMDSLHGYTASIPRRKNILSGLSFPSHVLVNDGHAPEIYVTPDFVYQCAEIFTDLYGGDG